MQWRDTIYQPTSRLLRDVPMPAAHDWLRLVERRGLMRLSGEPCAPRADPMPRPEAALGAFFAPDSEVRLDVLQVAGLLLRDGRLDRHACGQAARRHGGRLYFDWFMAQLDPALPDPLPDLAFPLHRSRWAKRPAGRRQHRAQQ